MNIVWVVILSVGAVVCFIMFLFVGFWMGRQTQDQKMEIFTPNKAGGQPVIEEDPYADALRREKSEGSL